MTSLNSLECQKECLPTSEPQLVCHRREDLVGEPREHRLTWAVGSQERYLAWVEDPTNPAKDQLMRLLQDPLIQRLSDRELASVVRQVKDLDPERVWLVTSRGRERADRLDRLAQGNGVTA